MAKVSTKGIPVLMYHALEDETHPAGARDAGEQRYVLQVSQFREQMGYLHREGYRTFLLDELLALAEWPDKAVVLTFDDGHESNFTLALPILQEYGFKAEFFITTGWIGTPYFMNEEQIRGLHRAGMGIGSHGVTHDFISDLDDAGIDFEMRESKNSLEQIIDTDVRNFSAPGGRFCRRSANVAGRVGYVHFITSEVGVLSPDRLSVAIPRCTINSVTSEAEFAAIIASDGEMIGRMARKAKKLDLAKMVLGNRAYTCIRKILLGL